MTRWLCSRVWVFLDFKKPGERPSGVKPESRHHRDPGPAWLPTWPRLTRFERSRVATQVLFFRGFLNIVFKLRLSRHRLADWKLVYRYTSNTAWRGSCVEKFVSLRRRLLLGGAFLAKHKFFRFLTYLFIARHTKTASRRGIYLLLIYVRERSKPRREMSWKNVYEEKFCFNLNRKSININLLC